MNNNIPGKIYFSYVPENSAKYVCARNCSQTTKEQASTISKQKAKKMKLVFMIFGWTTHLQEGKHQQADTRTNS